MVVCLVLCFEVLTMVANLLIHSTGLVMLLQLTSIYMYTFIDVCIQIIRVTLCQIVVRKFGL